MSVILRQTRLFELIEPNCNSSKLNMDVRGDVTGVSLNDIKHHHYPKSKEYFCWRLTRYITDTFHHY